MKVPVSVPVSRLGSYRRCKDPVRISISTTLGPIQPRNRASQAMNVVEISGTQNILQRSKSYRCKNELMLVKPFFVCKFTFRLQPAMLPVVFVVRMLSPLALEHRSPMKQPHFVSILCFFASIAFHVNR